MLASIVGNSEAVIKTTDLELFKRLMKFVSVTASMLVSKSVTSDTASSGADIVKMAVEDGDTPADTTVTLPAGSYSAEPVPADTDDDWDDEEW
jgi:hypothetical protein